jgi:hypothetical protein
MFNALCARCKDSDWMDVNGIIATHNFLKIVSPKHKITPSFLLFAKLFPGNRLFLLIIRIN